MITLTVQRTIAAPAAAVFDWLADSSHYTAAPLVLHERRVKAGVGAPYGAGAQREVVAAGAWFREEITRYDRPDELGYAIVKSFPRFERHRGRIRLEPVGAATRVVWTSEYAVPLRWGGRAVERLSEAVLRWSFAVILKAADRALAGDAIHGGGVTADQAVSS